MCSYQMINTVPQSPSQQIGTTAPFPFSISSARIGGEDMDKWMLKKLTEKCAELGIKGYSKKKKEELIAMIREKSGQNVVAPQVRVPAIPQTPTITLNINKPMTPSIPILQNFPQTQTMTLNINKPMTPIQLTVPQQMPLCA